MATETQQKAWRVAFIGLGNMGGPMAANLVKAGHAVRGFDLSDAALARLTAAGGTAATSIADAVRNAQVVITMLPAGEHVLAAYDGPDGVLAHAAPDAVLIDSSTVPPEIPRQLATLARPGTPLLDAPVSGGTAGRLRARSRSWWAAMQRSWSACGRCSATWDERFITAGRLARDRRSSCATTCCWVF